MSGRQFQADVYSNKLPAGDMFERSRHVVQKMAVYMEL